MNIIKTTSSIVFLVLILFLIIPVPLINAQQDEITPEDLIYLVNTIRTANGLPALRVASILMSTAQNTAETMAAENLTWHIGKPAERIKSAGYGTGYNVWATENFAMSWGAYTLADVQQEWADATHMIPMVNPAYCDIGAGVATAADGTVYYIVHAAYTSAGSCGKYQSPLVEQQNTASSSPTATVEVDTENTVDYKVVTGDALWSIAIANDTSIAVIKGLNELNSDSIYIGQTLKLPAPHEANPTFTPTLSPTVIPTQGEPVATQKLTTTPTSQSIESSLTPKTDATQMATATPENTPITPIKATEPTPEVPTLAKSSPALAWQIIAAIEFIALVAVTAFVWKPWEKR